MSKESIIFSKAKLLKAVLFCSYILLLFLLFYIKFFIRVILKTKYAVFYVHLL